MKMKMKMKTMSHRYDINRPRSTREREYSNYKNVSSYTNVKQH